MQGKGRRGRTKLCYLINGRMSLFSPLKKAYTRFSGCKNGLIIRMVITADKKIYGLVLRAKDA
jgi:hypothetical protein